MELLAKLWLAIPLAALAVWVWSFLSWAVLNIHKNDTAAAPNEDRVRDALAKAGVGPGVYMFPYCADQKQTRSPEFQAKWKAGPVGQLSVWNPSPSMAGNMLATFGVFLAASFLIAYLLSMTLPAGAGFWRVFQAAGTAGVLTFTVAGLPSMIWFQATPHAKITCVIDGVIMGLICGAVLAAMWPGA
jgi:hypothetical protein